MIYMEEVMVEILVILVIGTIIGIIVGINEKKKIKNSSSVNVNLPDVEYNEKYEFDLYVGDSSFYSDEFIKEYCDYHERRRLHHPELYEN